jgi:hypothetical protein
LNTWRESPFYFEPERAALELTEVVTISMGLLQARKSTHGILRLRRFPLKPPDCGRLKNVKGQLAILPKTVLFCNIFSCFLARTTADGINTIKRLFENGIKVHVLNMGLVEDKTGISKSTLIRAKRKQSQQA